MNIEGMQEEKPLLITIGYMLKIMKNGLDYSLFKKEFDHIRHGNYDAFIEEVKIAKTSILTLYAPEELIDEELSHKNFGHWMGMFLAIPSIVNFHLRCKNHFGIVSDGNFPDTVFIEVAFFEIVIRMHADLVKIIEDRSDLDKIIDSFFNHLQASEEEIKTMHLGRSFLNDIKHTNKKNYKRKFNSWEDGYDCFREALKIVEKYDLKFRY